MKHCFRFLFFVIPALLWAAAGLCPASAEDTGASPVEPAIPAAAASYAVKGTGPVYKIEARLDAAQKSVRAAQTVTWTNPGPSAVDELVFHIYPNRRYSKEEQDFMYRFGGYFKVNPYPDGFPARAMDIAAVEINGQALAHEISGEDRTLLKVRLPAPLAAGETVTVDMLYTLYLPHAYGRYGWHDTIIKLSRWYPVLAVYQEGKWNTAPFFPFHRPFFSESARYEVSLEAPPEYTVIHTGQKVREEAAGANKKLFFKTELPVREFTLAMSPDYRLVEDTAGGVTIKSYYLPGEEAAARLALADARDLMRYYSGLFGPLPDTDFSIAPVHLGYGGEQMGNMIFLDTRVYALPRFLHRYFDFLVSHETGHLWFYNLVGMDEFSQMWLEEGVNSYFVSEYLASKYGEDAQVPDYPSWMGMAESVLPRLTFKKTRDFRYRMLAQSGIDHPVVDNLSGFQEPSSIFSLTYGKGSRVVAMLRHYLGEEKFAKVFKRVFQEYRFANLKMEDFIRICEEESGQNLRWFFDQWLYKGGRMDAAVVKAGGRTVTLKNQGEVQSPVPVEMTLADGSRETFVWDMARAEDTITFDGAAVESSVIDPDGIFLDVDRVNNRWPRKFNFRPVPFYWGLYDIPLFLPDDGYNIVVGPDMADSGIGVKASLQKPYDWITYAGTSYEFGEELHHSRFGAQRKHVFSTMASAGFEVANVHDLDGGEEDLASGKLYLRQELWPAAYGLLEDNDHWTLYLVRNQRLSGRHDMTVPQEEDRQRDYSRREEAITGAALHINRTGPYPDPRQGWKLDTSFESAGHFLGAGQYFYRLDAAFTVIQPVTSQTRVAARIKAGWGYPDNKELFYLGGMDGLRGYKRKDVRGANVLMANLEYRFPLLPAARLSVADNLLGLESLGGVVFFDGGKAWMGDFSDPGFKKNAGAGLRFKINIGSFLEQALVRLDVAHALGESKQDTRFWLGVSHAF
ncbi:MAG TPA: M1 family aminopeptidase [Candidatus Omnitrophota bacterium]|nr:BamA/TamA family outer membrane protein [Candidatus Omnitrophota bacterium]HQO58796.1 M1 family aminopeptidase [Candidatus Omnitrophota bacterium]